MALSAHDVGRASDASIAVHDPGLDGPESCTVFERVRARAELALIPIELHAHRLLTRHPNDAELEDPRRAAAALARGLGDLQLHNLAQLARHIEGLLDDPALDAARGMELAGAVEDIRTMLASAIAQLENSPALAGTILAVGAPTAAFDATLWVLSHHGHSIVHCDGELPDLEQQPDVILVGIGNSADPGTQTTLRAIAETFAAPVIVFHDSVALEAQADLANHCTTLLPSHTTPSVVSEEIARLRAAAGTDLSATVWGYSAAVPVLVAHGYDVKIASDLGDLAAAPYGAIVFGSAVRPKRMAEVTRLIRVSTAARRAPVVWQGPLDDARLLAAARLGAVVVDDFDDAAVVALTTELRRAAADADPTDVRHDAVLQWPAARLLIDRSLIAAQRSHTPNAVGLVRLGDDSAGRHDEVEELLVREFRRGDVVGSHTDGDYVIALQGIGRRVALDRLGALAPRLGDDVRIGVAEFPGDGRSAEDLVNAAGLAVTRAAETSGPAVVSTVWRPAETMTPDLLVIDADIVLGEMLAAALGDRGHRTEVMTEGHEALRYLTTSPADALPKILMIDLDVGGADGRALLGALGPAGLLAHMKVLVMSSRAAENDIRMALDLGAADVIRKPFPITLLLHRIIRLLAA